jgi:hypothetical protein
MKHRKQSPRRGSNLRSKAKPRGGASCKDAHASAVGRIPDFAILPNTHDQLAISKLRSTPIGELAADRLVRSDARMVPVFRQALVDVYFRAAKTRELGKATRRQVSNAKSALTQLMRAVEHLERVTSDGRDGLRMLLEGSHLDDEKGERELNQLASTCWGIRMDVVRSELALQSAISAEAKKQTKSGERRKRLRTLVDALADWWLSAGGRSLAPYVEASRRDGDSAIVHGRSGKFLSLAIALFCSMDHFKRSEVEAAVTNVHEARLASSNLEGDAAA